MSNQEKFQKRLEAFKKEHAGEITCFTISNTSKEVTESYFTPIRKVEGLLVTGIVVKNVSEGIEFAEIVDGNFDYVAVDAEKKISEDRFSFSGDEGNLKGEIQDRIKKSQVISFKANDVTVEAIDAFVCDQIFDLSQVKVAIVGLGNIGFKLGLKLVERGCWVNCYRRDQEALNKQIDAINLTKPKSTYAVAKGFSKVDECLKDVDVIICTANASNIISEEMVKMAKENATLIDCGKFCFATDVMKKKTVFRTDVTFSLMYNLKLVIESREKLFKRYGVAHEQGKRYVCGVSGVHGDVVVTDINNPSETVLGVCDGKGGLLPS